MVASAVVAYILAVEDANERLCPIALSIDLHCFAALKAISFQDNKEIMDWNGSGNNQTESFV